MSPTALGLGTFRAAVMRPNEAPNRHAKIVAPHALSRNRSHPESRRRDREFLSRVVNPRGLDPLFWCPPSLSEFTF